MLFRYEGNLHDMRLAFACVAMHVIEDRAEGPFLRVDIPDRPGIVHYIFRSAFLADHADFWFFLMRRHSRMMTDIAREGRVGGQ